MSKKNYGGKSSAVRSEDWSKQLYNIDSPVQPVPNQELDSFRQDFLRAAQRARLRLPNQHPRNRGLLLRLALSSFALIAVISIGLCMLMTASVEAFSLEGLQGQVFNAADGLPIPNVAVRNLKSGQIIGHSDTWGVFIVDAQPGESVRYALELDQHKIAECIVGTDSNCLSGYQRLSVALPQFKREEVFRVKVAPGKAAAAGKLMRVTLQSGASSGWTGKAVQQHSWPQVFNYGRVVDGVFSLRGPAGAGLSLSVAVSAERLRSMDGRPEDLKVIAFDTRYASDDQVLLLGETDTTDNWVPGYHRGWFRLDDPQAGYLPKAEPKITPQSDGGAVIAWPAEVGRQYALLLPPEAQGTVTACYVKSEEDPSAHYSKELLVLDQRRPMMGVYDVEYSDGVRSIPVLNEQPLHSHLRYPLETDSDFVARDGKPHRPLLDPDAPADIPGELIVHLYDFTLTQGVAYPPIKAGFPPHGEYSIVVNQANDGATTQLEVTGTLEQLEQPPRWDFGTDYHDDSFGNSSELETPNPASYRVNVTLYEKNGAVVRLSRRVNIEAGDVLGFSTDEFGSIPIIKCAPDLPKAQSTYMAQTAECVADPLPYGYCTGSSLGPKWLFTPPDTMCETPLKELHIVMYVKPLGGDTSPDSVPTLPATYENDLAVYLSPSVSEVGPIGEWAGGTPAYSTPSFMQDFPMVRDIALTEVSNKVRGLQTLIEQVKPRQHQPELEASLVDALIPIYSDFLKHQDECRINGFYKGLGLDLANLSDKHEVAQKLYNFYHSPYYSVRFASRLNSKIEWTINLHGTRIGHNNSLLVFVPMETQGLLINAQYDLLSGGETPASITLTPQDGAPYTAYLDYSAVTQSARQPVKQRQD